MQSYIKKFTLVTLITVALTSIMQAQDKPNVANLIQSKQFVFVAETVNPMAGRTRTLTSMYDLRVTGDTVIADLPYFGRAYSTTYNMSGGGIEFESTDFSYVVTQKKKSRYVITINPKDASDVRELTLTVFENGRADLRVNSDNRQSIGFSGYVQPLEQSLRE